MAKPTLRVPLQESRGLAKDELELLVEKKEDVISVPSYDLLTEHARQLSIASCETSGAVPFFLQAIESFSKKGRQAFGIQIYFSFWKSWRLETGRPIL